MPRSKPRGTVITIFLPDDDPDGLRVVTIPHWTGCGVACPRALFSEAKVRSEMQRPGVYVLWGPPAEGDIPLVYIGEAESVRKRLEQHHSQKDFWTLAVAFSSTDASLNRAHREYLEARLLQLAAEGNRCSLDNQHIPTVPSLPEAELASVENYLGDILGILPLLGVTVFQRTPQPEAERVLTLRGRGVVARGYDAAPGFVVLAGSQAALDEAKKCWEFARQIRRTLIDRGVLVPEEGCYRFADDYVFKTPSSAAQVVMASVSYSVWHWKDGSGRTLTQIRKEQAKEGTK